MADFAGSVGVGTRKNFNEEVSAQDAAAAAFSGNAEEGTHNAEATQLNKLINEASGGAMEPEQEPTTQQAEQPSAPVTQPVQNDFIEEDSAAFAVVDVDKDTLSSFAKEYSNLTAPIQCVADCQMLLEYMVSKERATRVTMSFHTCGVDPVAFDQMAEQSGEGIVSIAVPNEQEPALYEKILVDDVLYLSCLSECLNKDYLHQVISEATEAIFVHGVYTYTMVGPRPIDDKGGFINTLKLNSYEMSVLMAFMDSMGGVSTKHCIENGRATIKFYRE